MLQNQTAPRSYSGINFNFPMPEILLNQTANSHLESNNHLAFSAMSAGRPSEFTPEIGFLICEGVTKGKSLPTLCDELEIGVSTIFQWMEKHQNFAEEYTRAREAKADVFAEQATEIADNETLSPESRRVRIQSRQWFASKIKPKVYGDKTILSGDAENPIVVLAARLDDIAQRKREAMIDVTPGAVPAHALPADDGSDLV